MKKLIIISLIALIATGCKKFVVSDDIIVHDNYVGIPMEEYDNLIMYFMIKDNVATFVSVSYRGSGEIDLIIPSYIHINGEEYIVKNINIGYGPFELPHDLHSVTIPNTVIDIGREAFYHCDNLCYITCLSTIPPNINTPLFNNYTFPTIYVPKESVGLYKVINGWKEYSSYIVGIE